MAKIEDTDGKEKRETGGATDSIYNKRITLSGQKNRHDISVAPSL